MADGPAVCRRARRGWSLVGRHSDRTGERKWHVAICALVAASGLLLAVAFQDNVWMLVLSFTLSQLGQRSLLSVFWAIPPIFLGGTAAAAGIALDQLAGQSRRRRRPHRRRVAARVVGQLHVRPARAGRGAGHRGDPGRVDAVAAHAAVSPAAIAQTCLNMSASVITAATAIPMTTARLIQSIAWVRLGRRIGAGGGDDVGTTGLQ